jgi:predicted SAM-dependent methyltransferase
MIGQNIYYKYKGELYPEYLNKGNAMSFIIDVTKKYCVGRGIDIGAGAWPFPGAIPIDNDPDQNAYKLDRIKDNSLDYVFSSHCLEHLEKWQTALDLWIRKLKSGGILFLYLPHKSQKLWRPGSPGVRSLHKWVPTVELICPVLESKGMKFLEVNVEKDRFWSFHIVAIKE